MKYSDLILIEKSKKEPIPFPLLLLADESIDAIEKYIYKCKIYLVKSTNSTVGVCAVQEKHASAIEIKNLAVTEKFRNSGIGSWCLQKIEAIHPHKHILVGTGDGSADALRFYKKNGFKPYAIRKNFFINNYNIPVIENGIQLRDQIVLRKNKNRIY